MRKHKYGAKKTALLFKGEIVTFDSMAESLRAAELQTLEMADIISGLELQPSFELMSKAVVKDKLIRAIVYKADFKYIERGSCIIEDVKGMETPVFKLKMKMFRVQYPMLTLRISKRSGKSFSKADY